MRLVTMREPISISQLKEMAETKFGNLVKVVVDVSREVMMVDADLHADQEAALLKAGSKQGDLWGINLYPQVSGDDFVEFDSMINLRPSLGNSSRQVESENTRQVIRKIVNSLVKV